MKYLQIEKNLVRKNGVIYRKTTKTSGKLQLLVPKCLQLSLSRENHNLMKTEHSEVRKTSQRLREIFYWFTMNYDIRNLIIHCEACSKNRQPEKKYTNNLRRNPKKRYAETIINVSAEESTKKRNTGHKEMNTKKMRYTYDNEAIVQKTC
jgi:hypothetical protein